MRLAFHAPMKSPDHPVPSGDRTIARGLLSALAALGVEIDLPSRLRSRDGTGDAAVQKRLIGEAEAEVARLRALPESADWACWITYHNYYKAPDLIGPAVAGALDIPYLQIESTRAAKRLGGPWDAFARRAEAAADAAAVILSLSARDEEALRTRAPEGQHLMRLKPFLDRADLPRAAKGAGPILCVGMMREGDKLASYRLTAGTLAALPHADWRLQIVGDGPARGAVEALFAPFGARVQFLGRREGAALEGIYRRAGIFLWPGVNEALGLVYLEAQAAGLPVVAQDRPGMRDVLAPGAYPTPQDGPSAMAARLDHLLTDDAARRVAGRDARAFVAGAHLRGHAVRTLREALARAGVEM